MDLFLFLARFFYRIRYILLFGLMLTAVLSVYLTSLLPKKYVVTTTVFTGITSKTSLEDMSSGSDWNASNTAHDNIINLVKSKSTLQSISVQLLAQHLIYGDAEKSNSYITAEHYRDLVKIVPKEVWALVDKNSLEKSVQNLTNYRTEDKKNFVYAIFSWKHEHYSYLALSKIAVKRRESSDMIEISYESNDPGIAAQTVGLLNKEVHVRYESLLLSASNDVVRHFEEQLKAAAATLSVSEDDLVTFNTDNKIINYAEQTKSLTELNNSYESRYEEILLANHSSKMLMLELENQMKTRTRLVHENETFLNALSQISTLNGQISEIEIFGGAGNGNEVLDKYKANLGKAETQIKEITDQIDVYKYSKEGVAIVDMVNQWLNALIKYEKTRVELEVMQGRKQEIEEQYAIFSPVGPNLNRKDREVRVAEQTYLTILHHLGLAKLKQKNILLNSGTLQIVTAPEFPLLTKPRKREIYVLTAMVGAFVFICGFFFLIESFDQTIRDKYRAERITSGKVAGVFPQSQKMRFRGYNQEIQRQAAAYLANRLNHFMSHDKRTIINLCSMREGEGKSLLSDQLKTYWEGVGFRVREVSYHNDFDVETKHFMQAPGIDELLGEPQVASDILLVEYPALDKNTISERLLKEASVNLLILDSERAWTLSDQALFDQLTQNAGKDHLFICLNRCDREAMEDVLGQLPPYTTMRNMVYKLFNFGLTAKNRV